jgi:hypothetical protein
MIAGIKQFLTVSSKFEAHLFIFVLICFDRSVKISSFSSLLVVIENINETTSRGTLPPYLQNRINIRKLKLDVPFMLFSDQKSIINILELFDTTVRILLIIFFKYSLIAMVSSFPFHQLMCPFNF